MTSKKLLKRSLLNLDFFGSIFICSIAYYADGFDLDEAVSCDANTEESMCHHISVDISNEE